MILIWKQRLLFLGKCITESDVHTTQALNHHGGDPWRTDWERIAEPRSRQSRVCVLFPCCITQTKGVKFYFRKFDITLPPQGALSQFQTKDWDFQALPSWDAISVSLRSLVLLGTPWQVKLHFRVQWKCPKCPCKAGMDKTFMWPYEAFCSSCSFRLWFHRFSSMNPK